MSYFENQLECLRKRLNALEGEVAALQESNDITYVSTTYTVLPTDSTVVANSAVAPYSITLPLGASVEGQRFTFKRVPALGSDVTLLCSGSDLIDAATSYVLANDWQSVSLRATTTGYIITASYND